MSYASQEQPKGRRTRTRTRTRDKRNQQARQLGQGKQSEDLSKRVKSLLNDYMQASKLLDAYHNTKDLKHLREAAGILCRAHQRLQEDEFFWSKLSALPDRLEKEQQEVEEILRDFENFLTLESHVLVSAVGLTTQEATKYLDNVNYEMRDRERAVHMVLRYRGDEEIIQNLRARSRQLQEEMNEVYKEVSSALSSPEPASIEGGRHFMWSLVTRKSLLFIGGAAQVSYNIYALTQGLLTAPQGTSSEFTGVHMMIQQFPEWKTVADTVGKAVDEVKNKAKEWWTRYAGGSKQEQ